MKKITTIFTAFLVLAAFIVNAQEQPSLRQRADQHYHKYEYALAVPLYLTQAQRDKTPRLQTLERLADSYYKMADFGPAAKWYGEVVKHKDHRIEHLREYGMALMANGSYAEAKASFENYIRGGGPEADVAHHIAGCDSAAVWVGNPSDHVIENQAGFNSGLSEFAPSLIGDKLYFVRESAAASTDYYGWTGHPFLRLYQVDQSGEGQWSDPGLFEDLFGDHPYHVGPVASPDEGKTLYVTVTSESKEGPAERIGKSKFVTRPLAIKIVENLEDGSVAVRDFEYNNIEEYSVGHAAFSADGKTLYFASDMPGGHGGTDIWYAIMDAQGNWGVPINAGAQINTAGNELFPALGISDSTLFFSSDGHIGMGGLDIFQATGVRGNWETPANLGYPLNSPADDFGVLVLQDDQTQQFGFISSNRSQGAGGDDIYSFLIEKPQPEPIVPIVVAVAPEPEPPAKEPTIMQPVLEVGHTFVLENLYYDFDKHNIRPDAAIILDDLVKIMNNNPTLKIELSSHTDSRGSDSYNMALSQRRAQAAVDYLVSRGIARDRMVAQGYGETRLVNECANDVPCSAAAHQANRRTEVTILEL